MSTPSKLTENQTIHVLINHLTIDGWQIISHCLGQTRGIDIVAERADKRILIEVKGAKADDNSPTKKRTFFDSGQIKTHFGKAIVKMLEEKSKDPTALLAIAHPNDPQIKKIIGTITPLLKKNDILHFWVSDNGEVTID